MKIAVIGTNVISDTFMSAAVLHPEFELGAVCGTSLPKAEAFAAKYGGAPCVDDYRKLPSIPGLEGVYIASPNNLHHAMTVYLLKACLHVLCEKPLAPTLAQAEEMMAAAEESGVLLMEAIMPPYTPNFAAIRDHLGEIGKVRKAVLNYCQYSRRYDNYRAGIVENAFHPEKMGGSLLDIGIYPLYHALTLFGLPTRVAAAATMLESGVDGAGSVILGYGDKEVVLLHSKITSSAQPSEIQGEDGSILFSGGSVPRAVELHPRNGEARDISREQRPQSMWYELDEFIRLVKMGAKESSVVPRGLMLGVHQTIQKIQQSAQNPSA